MSGGRPTLGIYGPRPPERSGVANHGRMLKELLAGRFEPSLVANDNWRPPGAFDHVLYQIGASEKHHGVFRALRLRRGTAIVHEHNCLSYFYEAWPRISPPARREFLDHVSAHFGRDLESLAEVLDFFDEAAEPDRYSVDAGVESLFMGRLAAAITHSPHIRDVLRRRYPGTPVTQLPFPVRPLGEEERERGRRALGVSGADVLFGSFGFIGQYKRIEKVLAAWRRWGDRPDGTRLVIVGGKQYPVRIPESPTCRYLGYLEREEDFDACLAACDCAVQLRHPSLGETSAVVSKLAANGRHVITSRTPYTRPYEDHPRVTRVAPDENEVRRLVAAFRRAASRPPRRLSYDRSHEPRAYARDVARAVLAPGALDRASTGSR